MDSDSQCGLSVVRSLGRKGISVTAGSDRKGSLGARSRFSSNSFTYSDPANGRQTFLRDLIAYLDGNDHGAIFPVKDHISLLLARHKSRIEGTGTTIAIEDRDIFELAFDKARLFETLTDVDVPLPETHAPTSDKQITTLAESVEYPVVVKPRSKSRLTENGYSIRQVDDENYVDSPAELKRVFQRNVCGCEESNASYPIVQEHIPGTTTTTVTLAADGDVLAYFQEERMRTYPSSGGNSALLRAVSDHTMLRYAERILGHLQWTGPAMVEFMRTPAGDYYVIEVNGRYWGSLPFAINSGVNIPWYHYLYLCGVDPSPFINFGEYRTDILQRRLLYEDMKWLGERLRQGEIGALATFLAAFVRTHHTAVDLTDPAPTAAAFPQAANLGLNLVLDRISNVLK